MLEANVDTIGDRIGDTIGDRIGNAIGDVIDDIVDINRYGDAFGDARLYRNNVSRYSALASIVYRWRSIAIPYDDGDQYDTVGRLQYCTMEIDTVLALNTVRWRSVRYTVY